MEESDREICVCFHVPLRKLEKHCHLHKPKVASQLSECFGAGTGCGWCIPYLQKIFEQTRDGKPIEIDLSPEEYLQGRLAHRKRKGLSEDKV